jgi:hypothetical protein
MAFNGPMLSASVNAALAIRSITRAASLPILRSQQQRRQLHLTPRHRAPNNSLLGVSSSSSAPASYFQRPSLPANTIIRFVPQQTAWIVERMGKFNRILQPGLAILWPFLDRIAYVKSLKEAAIEIPSQSAITADNVTLELDGKFPLQSSNTPSYQLTFFRCTIYPCIRCLQSQLRSRGRRIRHLATSTDNNAFGNRSTDTGPRPERASGPQHEHHASYQ